MNLSLEVHFKVKAGTAEKIRIFLLTFKLT